MQEDIDRRLGFLTELLSCDSDIFLWTYSPEGVLLSTNCTKLALNTIFRKSGCFQYMLEYGKTNRAPLMLSNSFGLGWGAAFEEVNGRLERIHLLGPVSAQPFDSAILEQYIRGKVNFTWRPKLQKMIEELPVCSFVSFVQHIQMLHFCVTGERLKHSDIVIPHGKDSDGPDMEESSGEELSPDRMNVHKVESYLLDMIRNGDLNYNDAISNSINTFSGSISFSRDPLRHAKLGQVQFIALCCRAAIEGGLPSETAYDIKDAYVRDVENAKTISEVYSIGTSMYKKYITLVHELRVHNYSRPVQSTCDYLEKHLEENLPAQVLAGRVGYSDYYLSRMFKKETGLSIDEYVRNKRIEKAKRMLVDTDSDISDIAESLGFEGRNYFAVIFKKVVGIPPATYRKKYQHL